MAKPIRFPLEMANGVKVRTIEELRENFDLEMILGYYVDGKLILWLSDRYYDNQVTEIKQIDSNQPEFVCKLCRILGVDTDFNGVFDLGLIKRRNAKIKILNDDSIDEEMLYLIKRNWQTCLMEITHFQTFTGNYLQCRLQNKNNFRM